ncbi:MAG: class I SAM-dependent methyltransferase [Nevskiales bacterium]
MELQLISELVCPYCGGGFQIARNNRSESGRLSYGLLECRCFSFPVVDGVLLLSLAKGYGGAEEALQPYVPLQVAAITYLQRDDIPGLQGWIRRHLPLASDLLENRAGSYREFTARLNAALEVEIQAHMAASAQYEVVGANASAHPLKHWLSAARAKLRRRRQADDAAQLTGYYVSRFFAPRVHSLALQLGGLRLDGRLLSLCCGHGVFENLLSAYGKARNCISVDGQFLNLLITRRYANPAGNFICHDLQYPLPFRDGACDAVFSSTCLPEIPAQRSFAREAIRVTAPTGWTVFDSIWNLEIGVQRINPARHYRFCQNFFSRLQDYLPFFEECAAGREVGVDVPGLPEKYLHSANWAFGGEREPVLAARKDPEISIMVRDKTQFAGFIQPQRPWLNAQQLCVSPVFESSRQNGSLQLRRRGVFAQLSPNFAPAGFAGFPQAVELQATQDPQVLLKHYCAGTVALLPGSFDASSRKLSELWT